MLRRILKQAPLLLGIMIAVIIGYVILSSGLSLSGPELFVLGLFVGIPLYFLPAIVGRKKQNARAIFVLNLLLGWTFLGWVGALIWALIADQPVTQPVER